MLEELGNRQACIARELTKKHEEYIYGNLSEMTEIDAETLKGEMVIIIEGYSSELEVKIGDDEIVKFIKSLTDVGISTKDAIKQASEMLKISKNYIYKLIHQN
jgi:16S rRNA (cytidine1402-2'-O)-methyltransferase